MMDDPRDDAEQASQKDDHELTFEHGYGAQDNVLEDDETLADVAGVSEKEVREDLLGERREDADEKSEEDR
ncbi:hypothetical protein BH24DEI2_BH24DEI2_12980 [soil metagenome]